MSIYGKPDQCNTDQAAASSYGVFLIPKLLFNTLFLAGRHLLVSNHKRTHMYNEMKRQPGLSTYFLKSVFSSFLADHGWWQGMTVSFSPGSLQPLLVRSISSGSQSQTGN